MRDRLRAFLGEVYWSDLSAHAARDALIVVAEDLDLLDAGVAVASDDAATVASWIERRLFRKPSREELARWPADPAARFESLVVAPFVLVRPRRSTPPAAPN